MITQHVLRFLFLLILVILAGWYIDGLAHDELQWAARLMVSTAGIVSVVAGIVAIVAGVLIFYERFRTAQAHRRLAERDADVFTLTAPADHQVFVREMNRQAVWRAAHLDPAIRANGAPAVIEAAGAQRWATWQALHAGSHRQQVAAGPDLVQLPAGPIDLLRELDSVQRCLIVGASDSGKTTLLKHIMARRMLTSRVIAIDPHAAPGKWPAHKIFGVGRDYASVQYGLAELLQWMIRRYDDIGSGRVPEMGHSAVTVLIDEWRAIVKALGPEAGHTISTLLTESRKAAFSVFVATHSERVKALGIEGEGDLKDGFAIVRLQLVNGQRQATLDKGNGPIEVQLPGPFAAWQPPQQIEATALHVPAPAPKPTEQERQVLDLAEQGASKAQICEQVWGYKSSKLYPEIDRIIDKFSRAPVHVHRAPGENEAVHGAPEEE